MPPARGHRSRPRRPRGRAPAAALRPRRCKLAVAEAKPARGRQARGAGRARRAAQARRRPGCRARGARCFGKRALYGIVAGTCALIGIAALVLQFTTAPGDRSAAAAASTHGAARRTRAESRGADRCRGDHDGNERRRHGCQPATAAKPATTMAATTTPTTPPATTGAMATTAAPAHPVVAGTAAPHATPPRRASRRRRPTVGAERGAADPRPRDRRDDAAERQARCTEILQKASLEKITPAETDFFKRECK